MFGGGRPPFLRIVDKRSYVKGNRAVPIEKRAVAIHWYTYSR